MPVKSGYLINDSFKKYHGILFFIEFWYRNAGKSQGQPPNFKNGEPKAQIGEVTLKLTQPATEPGLG